MDPDQEASAAFQVKKRHPSGIRTEELSQENGHFPAFHVPDTGFIRPCPSRGSVPTKLACFIYLLVCIYSGLTLELQSARNQHTLWLRDVANGLSGRLCHKDKRKQTENTFLGGELCPTPCPGGCWQPRKGMRIFSPFSAENSRSSTTQVPGGCLSAPSGL